mmetsp:Transcript_18447/g.44056  ORF Transcript_18447/g.44056 Transcript_18447/m.44056 type:complete len:190 (+) Transcript_18447:170-739(+)
MSEGKFGDVAAFDLSWKLRLQQLSLSSKPALRANTDTSRSLRDNVLLKSCNSDTSSPISENSAFTDRPQQSVRLFAQDLATHSPGSQASCGYSTQTSYEQLCGPGNFLVNFDEPAGISSFEVSDEPAEDVDGYDSWFQDYWSSVFSRGNLFRKRVRCENDETAVQEDAIKRLQTAVQACPDRRAGDTSY